MCINYYINKKNLKKDTRVVLLTDPFPSFTESPHGSLESNGFTKTEKSEIQINYLIHLFIHYYIFNYMYFYFYTWINDSINPEVRKSESQN